MSNNGGSICAEKKSDWSSISILGSEASPQKKKVSILLSKHVEYKEVENNNPVDKEDEQADRLGFLLETQNEKPRALSYKDSKTKQQESGFDMMVLSDTRPYRMSNITESIPEISENEDSSSFKGEDLNSKMLSINNIPKLERVVSSNTEDTPLPEDRERHGSSFQSRSRSTLLAPLHTQE